MAKQRIPKEPCAVRTGTPRQMGAWIPVESEAEARKKALIFLRSYSTFTNTRRGANGSKSLSDAIAAVSDTAIHREPPAVITALIDEATNMRIVVEMKKGPA